MVSVMLKPASSLCNLKCEYCFYASLSAERGEYSKGPMSVGTAENVVKSALSLSNGTGVVFTFQGGEPMLRGLEFYEKFVQICERENKNGAKIQFCLQTNGTLIDDEWCMFLKKHGFLVGVSLDGNEEQNAYRVYPNGKESFGDVVGAIKLLQKYGVTFNVLSVVTKRLANSVRENYRLMKQMGVYNFQYINCLKPLDFKTGDYDESLYMTATDYYNFLSRAFRLYYNDNMRGVHVSVRSFDNYVLLFSGRGAEQCGMNGCCSAQFVVEGDGTVYPCDFYCTDEFELGNINEKSFLEMSKSATFLNFIKSGYDNESCEGCEAFRICRGGGCKREKLCNDFCGAYKKFYEENYSNFVRLTS